MGKVGGEKCDHKGPLGFQSWGAFCGKCGEPYPFTNESGESDSVPDASGMVDKRKDPWRLPDSSKRFEAIDEKGSDNFATSIYEADYKGLLIARCNQNGAYPHQVAAILSGLNGKQTSADIIAKQAEEIESLRTALSSSPKLEEVGFAEKAGDHLDIHIDEYLTWVEGEKLYRIRRV